ncbi:MAG: ABC transporter permease [Geminicoccaceae bacterium]|nr:MAG: ABC transporter permease [Geminicoccaceae bacterium]
MRLLNRRPGQQFSLILAVLPFLLVGLVYLQASNARLEVNPNDKLLPSPSQMAEAMHRMAFEEDRRTGQYLLWADTAASLQRLAMGVGVAALIGLGVGITIGLVPIASATLGPFVAVVSMVPPLAVLPILFIAFGLGELAKVVLIALGITPFLIRDIAFRVGELPRELLVKAQTLGASTLQIALRVVLPQMLPRLLSGLRLALGPAWLFLIAAEAIASTEGLGYRIFLVRRFLAMDVILPYVAWITLLAFLMDTALAALSRRLYPWAYVR